MSHAGLGHPTAEKKDCPWCNKESVEPPKFLVGAVSAWQLGRIRAAMLHLMESDKWKHLCGANCEGCKDASEIRFWAKNW
jgi:hypothetical protein